MTRLELSRQLTARGLPCSHVLAMQWDPDVAESVEAWLSGGEPPEVLYNLDVNNVLPAIAVKVAKVVEVKVQQKQRTMWDE